MNKVWTTKTADKYFTKYITERDKKCLKCGSIKNLQCSHFWSRKCSSLRYSSENCITLCYSCHYGNSSSWEYEKQGNYRDFMIKWLGKEKYDILEAEHHRQPPLREMRKELMIWLKPYRKGRNK